MAYVDQSRDALNPENSVWQEISQGLDEIELGRGTTVSSRAYCGWFGFKGSDQQ
jgi:ATPase subunit of ABC transporter with duplicated ATPase domains